VTIPISEALQKYMDLAAYYCRLGRLGTASNSLQSSTDGFFMYGGPQRSFTFHIDAVRGRGPDGSSAFPCMRRWCFRHGIDSDLSAVAQYGCYYNRGGRFKLKPPSYLSKTPEEQLSLHPTDRWVYFVQESGAGAIKIGTTKNVSTRVREMAVGTPHLLAVLAVIEGNRNTEQALHRRFRHARIRGEWFRPVPELLDYIASIKNRVRVA
jgi:hypothetical protein